MPSNGSTDAPVAHLVSSEDFAALSCQCTSTGLHLAWHPRLCDKLAYAVFDDRRVVHMVDGRNHKHLWSWTLPDDDESLCESLQWSPDGMHLAVLCSELYMYVLSFSAPHGS